MSVLRVLHLVGSPTNQSFCDMSMLYASGCIDALHNPAKYEFVIALVMPDGLWRFPPSLERSAVQVTLPVGMADALAILIAAKIDIAIPHLFCLAGMTDYRAMLDVLKVPYVGNRPLQMALAADKAKTRILVEAAGVHVPQAQLLRKSDGSLPTLTPTLPLPVVVKPNNADNSDGLTLVLAEADYAQALAKAFSFSDTVLVEAYIPLGREVRGGLAMDGDILRTLPLQEYRMDTATKPVRARIDKLKRDDKQELAFAAKDALHTWIVPVDDPITHTVWDAVLRCHSALGCEQYSLFDFRIDPQGRAWFLEAGLYCSFSPKSVLVAMMAAAGTPLDVFFDSAIRLAMRTDAMPDPLAASLLRR